MPPDSGLMPRAENSGMQTIPCARRRYPASARPQNRKTLMRPKASDLKRHVSARRASLEHVLVENEKIKASVEKAASDLTLVNDVLKQDEVSRKVMQQALTRNEDVEREVSKAADDLKLVNVTLANEMAERIVIESELASTTTDLAEVRDDLLNARVREKAALEAALHDPLTGLPNRASFEQGLGHGLIQATRHGWRLAVLFIDIDNFKSINDSYGHGLGDEVLVTIGGTSQVVLSGRRHHLSLGRRRVRVSPDGSPAGRHRSPPREPAVRADLGSLRFR